MSTEARAIQKKRDALRVGVVGLGIGASSILASIAANPCAELVAGVDIDAGVLARFAKAFPEASTYSDIDAACRDQGIEAIWISSPTWLHAQHAIAAARAGKHVIVSKPLATSVAEGLRILEACDRHGVQLIAGHSLGFSPAIRQMAQLAQPDGKVGPVHAIQIVSFTDWNLLPRTPDELDPGRGGGLTDRQSPHQIDAARLLGGGLVGSVSGHSVGWMAARAAPGFFIAMLRFTNGTVASISHNGYGYLVGAEIPSWGRDVGISGLNIEGRNRLRRAIRDKTSDQARDKDAMRLGGTTPLFRASRERQPWLPMHLGLTLVSCERGDLRHAPFGIFAYSDDGIDMIPVDDDGTWFGASELEELYACVRSGVPLFRDGAWGLATLEVTCAIKESHHERAEIPMKYQVPVRDGARCGLLGHDARLDLEASDGFKTAK